MGDSPDLCQREILQILLGLSTAPLSEWTSCPWWCSKVQRGKRWSNTQRGKRSVVILKGFWMRCYILLHDFTVFYRVWRFSCPNKKPCSPAEPISLRFNVPGMRGCEGKQTGSERHLGQSWTALVMSVFQSHGWCVVVIGTATFWTITFRSRSSTSFCHSSNYPIFYPHVYDAYHLLNGRFRNLNWRYLPYIRPIFEA